MKRRASMPTLIYIFAFGMAGFFVLGIVPGVLGNLFHINLQPFMDAIVPPYFVNFAVLLIVRWKDCD